MLTFDDYQRAAARTSDPKRSTIDRITNGALGVAGEAGEVIELVKKHRYHGHELNVEELGKELGDVLWYVSEVASAVGLSLSSIASTNVEKLRKRWPQGFGKTVRGPLDGYEWRFGGGEHEFIRPGAGEYLDAAVSRSELGHEWFVYCPTFGREVATGEADSLKSAKAEAEAHLRKHLSAALCCSTSRRPVASAQSFAHDEE